MKKLKIKNLIYNISPVFFIVVLLFFVWLFVKPYFWTDRATIEDVSGYEFYDNQDDLNSASVVELRLNENFQDNPSGSAKSVQVKSSEFLEEAIKNAEKNQMIVLAAGTYSINAEINKDISIVGQGQDTVIQAADLEKPIFDVNEAEFELSNLVLSSSNIGMDIDKSEVDISNVKFVDFSATSLYAKDSQLDFKNSYVYDSNSALKLLNSSGKIVDSIIKNNKKSGIQLINSDFDIERNVITENGSYGVFLDQNSEAKIEDNYIENNEGYNVRIEGDRKIYK